MRGTIPARRVAAIAGTLAAIAIAYHAIPADFPLISKTAQFLFFLPIAMASLWFGGWGGVIAAVAATIGYLPDLVLGRPHEAEQYGEVLDLWLMGAIFGWLAGRERRQRAFIEKTSAELRVTYDKLEESLDSLKRAERLSAVGQLAANLAHEIRNPLAAIDGAVDMLRSGQLPEEDRDEFLGIVQKEAKRLSRLLTEMLDYARPKKPEIAEIDPRELARSVATFLAPMANKSKVRIVIEDSPGIVPARCDPSQIKQVLVNLVLNGIQAMPQGGTITIGVYRDDGQVTIDVRDEGPGIPEEAADKLFSPFYSTKTGGTGLGLAVAQQIMHAHGGAIRAGSNIPRGAAFSLSLPAPADRK